MSPRRDWAILSLGSNKKHHFASREYKPNHFFLGVPKEGHGNLFPSSTQGVPALMTASILERCILLEAVVSPFQAPAHSILTVAIGDIYSLIPIQRQENYGTKGLSNLPSVP